MTRTGNNLPNGNFIPAIWSKKLNVKYYAQTCMMDIFNTNWEGEIKGKGSQVEIRVRPTVQIGDYTVEQDIQYQDITDEKITLMIDKSKYFAFRVDDVDDAQSDINILNELTQDSAFQMKNHVEQQIFSTIYADAGNSLSSLTMDKTNVLDWIVDAEVKLEEENVPSDKRWIVIPPKAAGYIQKSDLKDASITGDDASVLRSNFNNGRLGKIGGMTIYVSNNLYHVGTTYQCLAGHRDAVTYASQIVKVGSLTLEGRFAQAVRGLNVYGYKTVKPEALVVMPAVIA